MKYNPNSKFISFFDIFILTKGPRYKNIDKLMIDFNLKLIDYLKNIKVHEFHIYPNNLVIMSEHEFNYDTCKFPASITSIIIESTYDENRSLVNNFINWFVQNEDIVTIYTEMEIIKDSYKKSNFKKDQYFYNYYNQNITQPLVSRGSYIKHSYSRIGEIDYTNVDFSIIKEKLISYNNLIDERQSK